MGLLEQASLVITPNAVKAGKLYSAIPTDGTGDLDVVRATSATRVDENGLIEIPRTNLLLRSEEFDNASWNKLNVTVIGNVTTAPNGTLTADKIIATATNANHIVYNSLSSFVSSQSYNFSYYAKSAEYTKIAIRIGGAGYSIVNRAEINLSNGTIIYQQGFTSLQVQAVGNGWYRIQGTFIPASDIVANIQPLSDSYSVVADNYRFLGDDTSGIFVWGAQLEVGNVATEYIPTTSVIRTRFAGITQDGGSASNIPRLDYSSGSCPSILVEPQRTNSIRNSSMVGAIVGSPGTLPTNWATSATLSQTIVSKGVENGLDYIDYKLSGTASSVNSQLQFEGTNIINASNGQTWAFSLYAKIISAPNPPLGYSIRVREATATGTYVTEGIQTITITNSFQRFSFVRTNTGTATERIQPMLLFGTTVGQVYDFTVRVYAPQMELGSNATSYIPTTTGSVTRNADLISKAGISSLIGQTEGSVYCEINNITFNSNSGIFILQNDVDRINNRLGFRYHYSTTGYLNAFIRTGANEVVNLSGYIPVIGEKYKMCFTYNQTQQKFFINGVLVNSRTGSYEQPNNLNEVQLGSMVLNNFQSTVGIKSALVFKNVLTDQQAIQLTTL